MNAKKTQKIVVLATGGTIAGLADDVSAPQRYKAAQLGVAQLLEGVAPPNVTVLSEQVAQIDSKNMSYAIWQTLVARVDHWLQQDDVQAVVITHGTDTLEETAYVLQRVLQPRKPVVLTCAMRPANAPNSDGPANLRDAFVVAQSQDVHGVVVVCAGDVHAAQAVQKIHSHEPNAFTSGSEGPVGAVHDGQWQRLRATPDTSDLLPAPSAAEFAAATRWPRVEWVVNHAGADGRLVRALLASDAPEGWIVAGTGNGSVHGDLEAALQEAQARGAQVLRTSRCAFGAAQAHPGDALPVAPGLAPAKARVALWLSLLKAQSAAR